MSAANPILAPQTPANAKFPAGGLNTNEADQITIMVSGGAGLGSGETISVFVLDSAGIQQVYWNFASGAQYQLANGAAAALTLPGGPLYSFAKSGTVGAVGLDYSIKPRIGGGAS